MGRGSEILHGDLRNIQTALSEVLTYVQPAVPSWKFPEKLSTEVSLDDLLTTTDTDDRVNLLEGIIDRLLLLLQTSIKLWNDHRSLPLSLSSTVKKYCNQLLLSRKTRSNLQKQLTEKDKEISLLSQSLSKAQENCQLLQETLNDRPNTVLAHGAVPYEARKSLRINRIQSSQSDRYLSHSTSQQNHLLPDIKSTQCPSDQQLTTMNHTTLPNHSTVSTQTTETSFALCVRCTSTLSAMTSAASRLNELCNSLQLSSVMTGTDWKTEAELGTLEPGKWVHDVDADIENIRIWSVAQLKQIQDLKDTLVEKHTQEDSMKSTISDLFTQLESMKQSIAERNKIHARELTLCRNDGSARLKEMEAAQMRLQVYSEKLEGQLTQVQKEKDKLLISSTDIERQQNTLKAELLELRDHEVALHGIQSTLQSQVETLRTELNDCKIKLEHDQLELNKTTVLNQTLQRKHKVTLSRYNEVLKRLEEMDEETDGLRRELEDTVHSKQQLIYRVEELQSTCSSLHSQVVEYEEKSVSTAKEQKKLCDELTTLKLQLDSLSSELETEKEKCHLLATYPIDQSSSTPTQHHEPTQKHITANTIRILLLEEQNTELRESLLEKAREAKGKKKVELTKPIPLWHNNTISQAQSALFNTEETTSPLDGVLSTTTSLCGEKQRLKNAS